MRSWILGLVLFIVWLIGCRWYYVCEIKQMCGEKPPIEVVDDTRAKTLNLMDGDKAVLEGFDQFKFGNGAVAPDLNDNNKDFIAQAAAYLEANPRKTITITGNYLESEKDIKFDGFYENLGLARADAIRKKLVEAGIPEDRMKLNYNMITGEGASLDNPISFSASGPDGDLAANNNDGGDEIPEGYGNEGGEAFSFTNMSFSDTNFEQGSAVFNPGPKFISYADSVKTYLAMEDNKDKSLLLTGHACNLGEDAFNMRLGLKRAQSVKEYFEGIGVTAKIATDSKGETAPAFPNDDANRYKNRRVNVKIK